MRISETGLYSVTVYHGGKHNLHQFFDWFDYKRIGEEGIYECMFKFVDEKGTQYFLLWRTGMKQVSFDRYKDRASTWNTAPFREEFMKCVGVLTAK